MPEIVVAGEPRTETGKNPNRRLRASEMIPAVVYGGGADSTPISVSPKAIVSILKSASGENTLFDIDVGGKRRQVILKDYQVEPVTGRLLHADFYEVALDKALQVRVHVELDGTPVGVRVEGGVLDFITRDLEIECLPTDIPDKFSVDVSELALGQHVRVSQLSFSDKVTCLTDPDVVIAHVVAPRAEVEETPEAAEAAEGAEGAEGAIPEGDASVASEGESEKKKDYK